MRLIKDLDVPIDGRDVLVAEDVVDTGLTLNYLLRTLELRGPRDIAVCTLLDRPYRRLVDDLPIRYVGFTVPDEFFVGYGFDSTSATVAYPTCTWRSSRTRPPRADEGRSTGPYEPGRPRRSTSPRVVFGVAGLCPVTPHREKRGNREGGALVGEPWVPPRSQVAQRVDG